MIIWLTGYIGVGKTTLGKLLAAKPDTVLLDGDAIRRTVSLDLGRSVEDRRENNLRTARLAQELEQQGFRVVVAMITPLEEVRKEITKLVHPIWIYLYRPSFPSELENCVYEKPTDALLELDTEKLSVAECLDAIRFMLSRIIG